MGDIGNAVRWLGMAAGARSEPAIVRVPLSPFARPVSHHLAWMLLMECAAQLALRVPTLLHRAPEPTAGT